MKVTKWPVSTWSLPAPLDDVVDHERGPADDVVARAAVAVSKTGKSSTRCASAASSSSFLIPFFSPFAGG